MDEIQSILNRFRLSIIMVFLLVTGNLISAQVLACSQANVTPNGTFTLNGVTVTSTSSGSVNTYPLQHLSCNSQVVFAGALFVGSGGAWTLNLVFDKPVNNLVIALGKTGSSINSGNENFIFNTNGGPVSITAASPSCSTTTINGNEILSGVGAESTPYGGGGLFNISSQNNFTTLTINGAGGYQGSTLIFCASSIYPACNAGSAGANQTINSGTAPAALNLTGYTGNIQWQVSTDNVNFTNVSSGGTTATYSPGTLTATRYYRAVVTTGSCSVTSNVVTITVLVSVCYEDPALNPGQSYPVKHGITILGRAGENNGNWPMLRNSAYTALESKTKGFVITRNSNPETSIANPVVGMTVFDTDENSGAGCIKIYTGSGAGEGWKCFNTQTCP